MNIISEKTFSLFHDKQVAIQQKYELAVLFEETKDKNSIPHLLEEIGNPLNERYCEQFLYILSSFDCSDLFKELFIFCLNENDELAWATFALLEEQQIIPSQEDFMLCRQYLYDFEKSLNEKQKEQFFERMEYIEDMLYDLSESIVELHIH